MYRFIFAVLSVVVCFAASPVSAQHTLSGLALRAGGNTVTLTPGIPCKHEVLYGQRRG